MKRPSPSQVIRTAALLTAVLAIVGLAWGAARFGFSDEAVAARLERESSAAFRRQAAAVRATAARATDETSLVAEAVDSRERLSDLFERLRLLAAGADGIPVAITVYVSSPDTGTYRVLAWSDGPGEEDVAPDRLTGEPALFVAGGYAGLRLVALEPVALPGDARAMAAVETVIAPRDRQLQTAYGPVFISEAAPGVTANDASFIVTSADGVPLVTVTYDHAVLARARRTFFARVIAVALLPLPLGLSVILGRWRVERGRTGGRARVSSFVRFALGTGAIAAACAGLAWLASLPTPVLLLVSAIGVLVIVTRLPGVLWWRASRRRADPSSTAGFAVEHLVGGVVLAAGLEIIARMLNRWVTLAVLDRGPFVLFPLAPLDTLSAGAVLLVETIVAWTTTIVLTALVIRWRLLPLCGRTFAAAVCWLLPVLALLLMPDSAAGRSGAVLVAIAGVAVVAGLTAAWVRRRFRATTQSVRLSLGLLAGLIPLLVLYPLTAQTAERATRRLVETEYAPATANHLQNGLAVLTRAQERVDEMTFLADLVTAPPSGDSGPAHQVWSQTGLEQSRVMSDVELYGADRTLVSRFAFNLHLPDHLYPTTSRPWEGSGCSWDTFGEVPPAGAEVRRILHAERGVCAEDGTLLGGIVVHVEPYDYQALSFIASPSPYGDVVGSEPSGPRLRGVRLAVYGWSSRPIFASDRAAWAVAPSVFERLYRTGEPFWEELTTDDGVFDVHFSQNRASVYAVGVPRVTFIEHATRLAEISVLVAIFFVLWQVGLLVHAALARRPDAPLRRFYAEVRTSFYRKLFIAFVVVAVVPVLVAAVAFGSYMTSRFRADVEYEAATTASVARRVFQELTATTQRDVGVQVEPNDDVMVWIRQLTGNDVNLFEGSELAVTSQRDLFDSGFLPTRTSAAVYRAITLERRSSFVVEDETGPASYIVAAAPVTLSGRDAVLTVPLAPRQREMERELDTLNRRVLVGAVLVVVFAALFGASLAGRIADPVSRLSRATRQISAGNLDVRITADTADELRRLVDDFNGMAATLRAQRAELARANQLKAWNEMARQVAHEIKNPLTPVQLAAEHLQHVHEDRGRPLGAVLDRCVDTVLAQVRLLRQIASEFSNFAGEPTSRPTDISAAELLAEIVQPYRVGIGERVQFDVQLDERLPPVHADRTLLARALTNLVENAVQAMPDGGRLTILGRVVDGRIELKLIDTGVGLDATAVEHAFEPYFSTKTGGSGLGLANARRNIEREGGTVTITSAPGEGATVTVTLRAAQPPSQPAPGYG